MALAYDLEAIMAHPSNRERIRKAAVAEIKAREQQEAIAEAEAARLREWGTELDQAEEKRKCRHGPVAGAPYALPSAEGCIYWLKTYVWTYNPKLVGRRDPETRELISPYVRFIPFPRQEEMVRWVFARCEAEEQGAVPKSRDIGATYIFGAVALHRWLFEEGFKATFGSRVEKYVDEKDNPDAIFPKIRIMARRLPSWMMPTGFDWRRDDNYMRLANPETGGLISGEGGKNMGRGGRAQPLTAKVLTPDGWRLMGDLAPGDEVIGGNGRATEVLSVHPQGVKPIFRVMMSDGAATECCDDHLWQVTDRHCRKVIARKGNRTWAPRHRVLKLSELRKGLHVPRPDGQAELQYRIPVMPCAEMRGAKLPLHPYVIGSLLGDGSLSQIDHTSPGFTTADAESVETLTELLEGYELRSDGTAYGYRIVETSRRGRHRLGHRNTLKRALIDLGMAGHKAASKSIPAACMVACSADRIELLRGLLDTDGWVTRRGSNRVASKVCFSTISPRLANDVVALARSIGGNGVITTRPGKRREFPGGRSYDCQRSYQVTLALPPGLNPFRLSRKAALYQERTKYQPNRSIALVERVADAEAMCITVAAADGLYVTDDYIVTHNSSMFIGDEAAFWENAEAVESALSGNSDVIFWVSSANGMGNLFARKVLGGLDPRQVFRFHYTDDPRKTAEWVAKKKQELSSNPVAWASEYEIDFAASLEGVCIPGAWVAACQELHRRIPPQPRAGGAVAGLDVGAGKSKSVFISRNGPRVRPPQARGDPDTTGTAAWALGLAREQGVVLVNFDAPGVGVGVTSALKHIPPLPNGDRAPLVVMPINTGGNPSKSRRWPDGRTSYETFGNLKAEIWWLCRTAAQRSFELLQFLDGVLDADGNEMGVEHDLDDCLLLPSKDPESDVLAMQLSVVKAETNIPGKIVIETKASLKKRGILSPDHADALVLSWVDKRSRYSLDALS